MTIETAFGAVLATVCPRVFADFASTSTARPYVTFQRIGGRSLGFVGKDIPNKVNAEFQVNVWSSSRGEADRLAREIEDALRAASTVQARPLGESIADADADLNLRSTSQDFSVWSDR